MSLRDAKRVSELMEDQSPTCSERSGCLGKEDTRPADLHGGKEIAGCPFNKDLVSPGIAPRRPPTDAMEEAKEEEEAAATSHGMTVQAIKTNQNRDSYLMYAPNFDHNHIPHQSTACEEEFGVLDLSVRPRGATAAQENRGEEESHISATQGAGREVRENSINRDGSRKRGRTGTEETPFSKKRLIQDVSSTSCEGTNDKTQSYICQECGVSFHSLPSLAEHQKSHTGYLAEQEGTYARGKGDVSSKRSSKEDRAFKCFECAMSFRSLSVWAKHRKSHTGYLTEQEGTYTRGKGDVASERGSKEDRGFQCFECGMSFRSLSSWAEHRKSHTGYLTEQEGTYVRGKGDVASERGSKEDRGFKCSECGMSFSSLSSWAEHRKSHTGYLTEQEGTYARGKGDVASERGSKEDRGFKCFLCGMSFQSLSSWAEHQKSHTGYLTEQEGTYARGKGDVASKRSSKEEPALNSLQGEMSFRSLPSFTGHQRSRLGDAAPHQRIHPPNELYICSECGHSSYSFSLFAEHQKSHTSDDEPFTIGKGHLLLPWMHPGFPRAALGPPANSAPLLGQASYPFSRTPLWGPFSLPHPTLPGTLLMHPFLDPRAYTLMPLPPTQASGGYMPGPAFSAFKLTELLSQERGALLSLSQKEARGTVPGGDFAGGEKASAEVLENQAEACIRPTLDISQTNQDGQSLFPCLDCGELKINATQLALHRRECKRDGLLRCPRCKKRFPNEASLRQHEKAHTSENP